MANVPVSVQRALCSMYGTECPVPHCHEPLIRFGADGMVRFAGQVAHIRSYKTDGPRFDPTYPEKLLHEAPNLMPLCLPHHDEADKAPWPIERMVEIQRKRRGSTLTWTSGSSSYASLHFANMPRLLAMGQARGMSLDGIPNDYPAQWRQGFGTVGWMIAAEEFIERLVVDSVPLGPSLRFSDLEPGALLRFQRGVRTLNGIPKPRREPAAPPTNLAHAPQIYMQRDGWRITAVYDPRWATTATAYGDLAHGTVDLGGLLLVKGRVHKGQEFLKKAPRRGHLLASLLLLGIPNGFPPPELQSRAPRRGFPRREGGESES